MTRSWLYFVTMLALALTVPWFFWGDSDARFLGFPLWAAFAVLASAAYAAVIAYCIGKFWDLSAGEDDEE